MNGLIPARERHSTDASWLGVERWLAEAIIAEADVAIFCKDLDGIIRVWNRAAERLYGYAAGEVAGRSVTVIVPEDRHSEVAEIVERIRAGERVDHYETVRRRKDGSLVPVSVTVSPIHAPDGRVVAASVIARDVSEKHRAEIAVAASERHRRDVLAELLQAEEAERSRIATALHDDTVQVMTASLMAIDRVALVARKSGEPRVEAALAVARATLEEATERTRRLMFELRPALLYDHGLVPAVRVLAEQTAREVGATARVLGSIGRYDYAIEEAVYRSVQEALANIRKHAHPDTITVTFNHQTDHLAVEVVDDGKGFDIVDARSRPSAALHLGLDTLVERIRATGGSVGITSTRGRGTSVRLTIPAQAHTQPRPDGRVRR
jgi:PAS domain S-box-containing protein